MLLTIQDRRIEETKQKECSLSWLVVSTRHYTCEYHWFLDKKSFHCYGIPKDETTGCIAKDLFEHYGKRDVSESYFDECVLTPELHKLSIEEAAVFLRNWCIENHINYKEDLDEYNTIEAQYWGYDFDCVTD